MVRLLFGVVGGLFLASSTWVVLSVEVSSQSAAAFSHETHLNYWASGRHQQDRIDMHAAALEAFGITEIPPEIAQGECLACHGELTDKPACVGCHEMSQSEALRRRAEVRPCLGCHPGAWTGDAATLPRVDVCAACHAEGPTPLVTKYNPPRLDLDAGSYVGGMRLTTLYRSVHYSHVAHVRFAEMSCATCHGDPNIVGTSAPTVPAVSMNACLRCHVENGARSGCLTCHK